MRENITHLDLYSTPTYCKDYKRIDKFKNNTRFVCGTSGLGGVWGDIDENESIETIVQAVDHEGFMIDTAPSYSRAEEFLGIALKRCSGKRPYISTKVGRLKADDAHTMLLDYSNEGLRKSFYNSLETIGVDKIDLLFLHEPNMVLVDDIPRILEVLISFKEEGLVDCLGIGGSLVEGFEPYMGKKGFEVVSGFLRMNACNLDFFKREENKKIKKYDLVYSNASILHFGLLGNKLPFYKKNFGQEKSWLTRVDIDNAEKLESLANQWDISLATLSQRYAFSIAEADRIVLGPKNLEEFLATRKDIEQGPLPEGMFDVITKQIMGSWEANCI